MSEHLIKFVSSDSKAAPVDVECSCGTKLPAASGIDAMRIAREHKEGMAAREQSEGCLCQHATPDFAGVHHDKRCHLAKEISEA
jgi:hypothetical protein